MTDSTTTFETFVFSGSSDNCYGLELVKRRLSLEGHRCVPLDYTSSNTVLVSVYWPEQLYDFIRWRFQNRMKHKRVIVGGNYATTSPQAIRPFCDGIFLGDGELWDGKEDSPFMVGDVPREKAVVPRLLPISYEDLQDARRSFSEISRGCRNKCLFCQYGWLKPYREVDYCDIEQILNRVKTKAVRVFAADRFQHSQYRRIRDLLDRSGKCDTGSDVSVRFVLKHPEFLQFTNKVRSGIEGMSYRLRRLVGKNLSDDDIVNFCLLVSETGIKCLDFYMIYGLPTEGLDDIAQFRELIRKIDARMPEGYTIAIHWNRFTPNAQTPFQREAAGSCNDKAMQQMFDDTGNSRIKVYHKPRLTSDWTILRRMLAIRSDERCSKLVYNFAFKESQFKKQPRFVLREFERATGRDLLGVWPNDQQMPWDRYVLYASDKMNKLRDRNMGMFGTSATVEA